MRFKKIKILSFIIFFLLIAFSNSKAAIIHIERNDVDSARAGFITAGFTFSLDIKIDSLDKFNGVSFELDWDRPAFIFFSEWQIGDIGDKSQAYVEKYPGKIIVAVSNGLPLIESQISNSTFISLKFVALQSAINMDSVTFTFQKPTASALIDSQSQLLPLSHNPTIFKIHSYIDVFPGDANNDGVVDHLDYSNVMLYLGLGSESQHSRTFKRLYPSIFWVPQKTLVWDISDATYSDCDGNGEITMKDMLVVSYNLGKNTTQIGKSQPVIKEYNAISKISDKLLSDNNSYPVYFQTNRNFISAYISIELNQDYIENLESININSIFNENNEIAYKKLVGNILY
ncbi:MAG TPA: dockerin type I domain-containing protein, partial [Candidatus Kapabacteria bacterium]|nr:dockerin type I domain-containing protein [Candidatus Kapabacteria bacterium]